MAVAETTSVRVPPDPTGPAARGRTWMRYGLAVAAGLALLLAFPPYGLWWLAPVGVALLAVAVRGRGVRGGAALGAVCGVALFVPMLRWTNLHTGAMPWLLLSGLQAAYLAVLGAAAGYLDPLIRRWPWTWPPLVAVLWTAQEALRSRTPFGGFPWGRLAFSQDDAPTLRLAALGGAPLVTCAVALCGGLLALAVVAARTRVYRLAAVGALAAAAVTAAGWLVPLAPSGGRAVTVAVVQGNVPRLGLDFNAQRRAVLDNHARATIELAGRVDAGQERRPDLVIWPENSSDIDPLRNPDAAQTIERAAAAIRAPILVGAVLAGDGTGVLNAGLVWQAGVGETQRYVKRHPVPFAEYVPLRPIARMVSKQVDLVRSDFQPGDRPGVLTMGPATVGDVICFEVAYDAIVADTVTGGAGLIAVQTNNATFDESEAAQQLAMVRLRAVEHARPAVMASTVGISSFVDTMGELSGATSFNTPAVVVREVRLGAARTLATRVGAAPEYLLVAMAVIGLVVAGWLRHRRRH